MNDAVVRPPPESPSCSIGLEIGGYFELALPDFGDPFPTPFLKYQSARAALRAMLEASSFAHVLLPTYICNSVIRAVTDAGRTIDFYGLDDRLLPAAGVPDLPADTAFLYVNYFGLCDENLLAIQRACPPNQLLVDNTQALFATAGTACAVIYSPRKFVGLPDGGILLSNGLDVSPPADEDTGSLTRMNHLLVRAADSARAGYPHFIAAGHSLDDTNPKRMSRLTQRLLASIDFDAIRLRRRANFEYLSQALGHWNRERWVLGPRQVPLCYPLVLDRDVMGIRRRLADRNIYIPTYWEDVRTRIKATSIEQKLLDRCLPLPCDQRYADEQLDRLVDALDLELR